MNRNLMPKCNDKRVKCFARTGDGKCFCLSRTDFEKQCPFYKPEENVKHLVSAREYKEAKDK